MMVDLTEKEIRMIIRCCITSDWWGLSDVENENRTIKKLNNILIEYGLKEEII